MRTALPAFRAGDEYYGHVSRGYDLISRTYDDVEAANWVGRRLRRHMQAALFSAFHRGDRVLEIGCGTGIEVIALAERGVEVVATDLSQDMVDLVRRKADARGLDGGLRTRRLAAHEIGGLVEEFGEGTFDGAYSHGGVLNMDPRIGMGSIRSNYIRQVFESLVDVGAQGRPAPGLALAWKPVADLT